MLTPVKVINHSNLQKEKQNGFLVGIESEIVSNSPNGMITLYKNKILPIELLIQH